MASGTATDSAGQRYTARFTSNGHIVDGLRQKGHITIVLVSGNRTRTLTVNDMFNMTSGKQTVDFSFQQTTCAGAGVGRITYR